MSTGFARLPHNESTTSESEGPANLLLAALPEPTYRRLRPRLERVELKRRQRLYGPGDKYSHVYFVESGTVSILVGVSARSTIEIAMVGREGMAGLPVFLGADEVQGRAIVQSSGAALRMTAEDFLAACSEEEEFARVMREFTYSIIVQISRSAVCNRFHAIDSRFSRWLLAMQDRMGSTEFNITQEVLSHMLGVRREAVNRTATVFQKQSLITYVRGHVKILDRPALERLACDCYGAPPNKLPWV